MSNIYTRQELYELIWEKPIRTIAKEIGVSDSALGKACRKNEITRPDQGYWAKLKAGKSTQKRLLAPRFPGAPNVIKIGGHRYQDDSNNDDDIKKPIGLPPTFDEDLASLMKRIEEMVGKVPYPTLSAGAHPIISKLLMQDEERKISTWEEPQFTSAAEKRRLRILNALFLYCHQLGCKPYMSTTKFDDDREASITVGEHHVSIMLEANDVKSYRKNNKKYLRLSTGSWRGEPERDYWEDSDEFPIENSLREIMVKIIFTGELQHREFTQQLYEWKVERREKLLEKECLKALEEERITIDLRHQIESVKIEKLLSDAKAHKQAETIRDYVSLIQEKSGEIASTQEEIDKWSKWALKQANRIDPIQGLSFLITD